MLPKCPFQHSHHTTPCFSFRGICSHVELCRKEDPFQHPKGGSCLSLGSELSEKTHMLTKQETLLGRGAQVESSRVREPRRTVLPCGSQSHLLGWWGSFLGCPWPIILTRGPSWWRQDVPARGFWEICRTCGLVFPLSSFWLFPNLSGQWELVSSAFLTRTACCKITHETGYCLSWSGWAVSVFGSPNRIICTSVSSRK